LFRPSGSVSLCFVLSCLCFCSCSVLFYFCPVLFRYLCCFCPIGAESTILSAIRAIAEGGRRRGRLWRRVHHDAGDRFRPHVSGCLPGRCERVADACVCGRLFPVVDGALCGDRPVPELAAAACVWAMCVPEYRKNFRKFVPMMRLIRITCGPTGDRIASRIAENRAIAGRLAGTVYAMAR